MKNLLWLFLFLSVSLTAQVQDTAALVGKFFGSQSGGGSGYWTVSGTFTDESGLYDSGQLQVGDILFFGDSGYGYFLPITEIVSATPPSFTVKISNVGITGVGAVPTGSGAIFKGRPNHLINPFASGLTNPDQQTYLAYAWDLIDNIGGGATYFPADGIDFLGSGTDSVAVDSSVMRYNILPAQLNDGTSTGYYRHNRAWGNQYNPAYNSGVFGYYSNMSYPGTANYVLYQERVVADAAVAGGGGFAGWDTQYDATGKFYTRLVTENLDGTSSFIALDKSGAAIGGDIGNGIFTYPLPGEDPPTGNDALAFWEWNGINHTARFVTADSAVQALVGPFTYQVTVTGANSGSNLFITSSKLGVTASYASNQLTVTIPAGNTVYAADWRLVAADVQASGDAGGVTNWTRVRFVGTPFNATIDDLRMPTVQKLAIPNSGALSLTNAATLDQDNNPAVSVTDVGSNAITIRIGGLSVGAQGFNLKITNL